MVSIFSVCDNFINNMRRVIRILVCTRLQRELESGIEKIVITHIKVWVKQYEQQIAATCLAIICCVASSGVMLACYYLLLYLSQSLAETCNIVVIRSTLCSNCNAKLLLHKVIQFVATQIETPHYYNLFHLNHVTVFQIVEKW